MSIPLNIKFRHVRQTSSVEETIQRYADHLEMVYRRIISCAVIVDRPHKQHQRGNRYSVHIQLSVPGKQLNIRTDSKDKGDYADLQRTLHEAFSSAEKMLKTYKSKHKRRRETLTEVEPEVTPESVEFQPWGLASSALKTY